MQGMQGMDAMTLIELANIAIGALTSFDESCLGRAPKEIIDVEGKVVEDIKLLEDKSK
jgi:hypothetical protein